jgi:hypothetical protein
MLPRALDVFPPGVLPPAEVFKILSGLRLVEIVAVGIQAQQVLWVNERNKRGACVVGN